MGYIVSKVSADGINASNWREFMADDETTIIKEDLPTSIKEGTIYKPNEMYHKKCAVGSICKVISTGNTYILNTQNEWVAQGTQTVDAVNALGAPEYDEETGDLYWYVPDSAQYTPEYDETTGILTMVRKEEANS